jgi:hypothetical protein
LNTATAPVWQTETSQIKWRGKLVVIELILNIAGFSLSNWITYGFSFVGGAVAWRVPLALQFIFIVILFVTVPWLPESPRWLIAHEYEDEAFKILADLEGKSENDPFIITQHKEIVYTVQYERANAVPWSQLLRGKTGEKGGTKTIRRLLLGMGTQFIQQMSGINVTSYVRTLLTTSIYLHFFPQSEVVDTIHLHSIFPQSSFNLSALKKPPLVSLQLATASHTSSSHSLASPTSSAGAVARC